MTDSKPSKSSRKREQLALQELGEQLIALNGAQIESFSLSESLKAAVASAARMTSRGALRRQKRLIGKLMRDIDPEPIHAQLAALRADENHNKRLFARAEQWRDRIAADGPKALLDLAALCGTQDEQLQSLWSQLQVAFSEKAEKTVRRKIFRRVHEILVKIPQ